MEKAIRIGISFGLTSGIITTLGLMIGLSIGTNSKIAVVGGILTIAIADAFSDALGIHISQESNRSSSKSVWLSTLSTLGSKFFFALTFLIPVLLFELSTAVIISVVWGLFSLGLISYFIAKKQDKKPFGVIMEHIVIAIIVIIITFFVGKWISLIFI
ncbi:MAG: hypothetical protein ABIC91_03745 [Nanoarchaeota archaeon]|nr:hypothetical protein [Nanoarchaeota archaeon]MBU1031150.1 hypothetical protein [Nanoarchaeota archaeon]MBU1850406.1 hypothetical protein [Nanoarchaeota archaeon]